MKMSSRRERRLNEIIEVANELATESILLDPLQEEVFFAVEDCVGYLLSHQEQRLALVAYNEDTETARRSIWYA